MTVGLKAIETQYKGYRFRSRLEARWAVFFDAIQAPYAYEPEGFDLDGEWYLPDFKLLHGPMACPCTAEVRDAFGWSDEDDYRWVEIKPDGGTVRPGTVKALAALAEAGRKPAYLLRGDPYTGAYSAAMTFSGRGWQKGLIWSECPVCGTVDLQKDAGVSGCSNEDDGTCAPMFYCAHCDVHCGRKREIEGAYWHKGFWVVTQPDWHPWSGPRLTRAFMAARGARFEHGESGAPR